MKKSFPNRKVNINQLNDGKVSVSVSITSTGQNQANNDSACTSDCYVNCEADDWCDACTNGCSEVNQCLRGCNRRL